MNAKDHDRRTANGGTSSGLKDMLYINGVYCAHRMVMFMVLAAIAWGPRYIYWFNGLSIVRGNYTTGGMRLFGPGTSQRVFAVRIQINSRAE